MGEEEEEDVGIVRPSCGPTIIIITASLKCQTKEKSVHKFNEYVQQHLMI